MTSLQSPLVNRLHPYVPGEQRHGANVTKLNTNENPYPPSSAVMQAIAGVSGDDLRRYPDPEARRLCEALALYEGVSAESVYVANGSDETLGLAFMAFFTGKNALQFPRISYSFYPVYCDLFAIESKPVKLQDDFSLDLNSFTTDAGGICFPNPNAPTGIALSLDAIESLLERYTTGVVLIDEAYADFGAESAIRLIDRYPNLLVTRTFSKGRSLAGMRVGAAFASPELIRAIAAVKNSFNSYPVDAVAQAAACASIEDDKYHKNCVSKIVHTRARLVAELNDRGFTVLPSAANFVFASPTNANRTAKQLFDHLNQHDVLVRHWMDVDIQNWLRISIGTDTETDHMLNILDQVLATQQ